MPNNNDVYQGQHFRQFGNVMLVRYSKLEFDRHQQGFAKGVAPLLQEWCNKGVNTVLVDLEETAYIESMTLGTIIKFKKDIEQTGISIVRILNPGPVVVRTFFDQNLDKVFGEPYISLEDALKDLQK